MTIVQPISRRNGVAGQYSLTVWVKYDDETPTRLTFYGSTFGGPVVMETALAGQVFVTDPGRFGEFGEEWVTRFLAASE